MMKKWLLLLTPIVVILLLFYLKGDTNMAWGDIWDKVKQAFSTAYKLREGYYQPTQYPTRAGVAPVDRVDPLWGGIGAGWVVEGSRPPVMDTPVDGKDNLSMSPPGGGSGYRISLPELRPPTYNRQEMLEMARRKAGLLIDPQIEALQRALENARQQAEAQRGQVGEAYRVAKEDLTRQGQQFQREGADIMSRRGLYDSGMAADLANRLQRDVLARGERLGAEHARALSDLAAYEALLGRQTGEQIAGLEARRGEWEKSILDEMEQQAFQRQLAEQEMALRLWQAQMEAQQAAARAAAQPAPPSFSDILNQYKLDALKRLEQNRGRWDLLPLEYQLVWGYQPWRSTMPSGESELDRILNWQR